MIRFPSQRSAPRRAGIAREDVLLALLLGLLAAIPLGYWVSSRWRNSIATRQEQKRKTVAALQGAFKPPTTEQLNAARQQPPRASRTVGKVALLTAETGKLERALFLLPEGMRAAQADEVKTTCWVYYRDSRVWRGAKAIEVLFVERTSGEIWRLESYEGEQNPAVDLERTFDPIDGQEYFTQDRILAEIVQRVDRGG